MQSVRQPADLAGFVRRSVQPPRVIVIVACGMSQSAGRQNLDDYGYEASLSPVESNGIPTYLHKGTLLLMTV